MLRQSIHAELLKRLREKRRFVQVLAGPRQVGKTTVVRQVMEAVKMPAHYASADEPTLRDRTHTRHGLPMPATILQRPPKCQ